MVQVSTPTKYFDISLQMVNNADKTIFFKFEDLENTGKYFIREISLVAHGMTANTLWSDSTRVEGETFYASKRKNDLLQATSIARVDSGPAVVGTKIALVIKSASNIWKLLSDEVWALHNSETAIETSVD